MSFRFLVVRELASITAGVVAHIAVEGLLFTCLASQPLSPGSCLLVGFGLSCFELRSSIHTLLLVIYPAVGDVLGFDVVGDLLQLLFTDIEVSIKAFFEGL